MIREYKIYRLGIIEGREIFKRIDYLYSKMNIKKDDSRFYFLIDNKEILQLSETHLFFRESSYKAIGLTEEYHQFILDYFNMKLGINLRNFEINIFIEIYEKISLVGRC